MANQRFIVEVPAALDLGSLKTNLKTAGQLRSTREIANPGGRRLFSVELEASLSGENEKKLRQQVLAAGGRVAVDRPLVPGTAPKRERPANPALLRQALAASSGATSKAPDGLGIKLAIIDKHGVAGLPVFGNRLTTFVLTNAGYAPADHQVTPGDNEGTNVAGIAVGDAQTWRGPAPKALLAAYKADWESEMIEAINHAIDGKEVKIIFTAWHLPRKNNEDPALLQEAVGRARDNKILVLAAGGNDGKDGTMLDPAIIPTVFAVGTYVDGQGGARAAPDLGDGVGFDSTYGPKGSRKPDFLAFRGEYDAVDADGTMTSVGGTSAAVGRAAGVLATWYQVLKFANDPVSVIEETLKATSVHLLENGVEYASNAQGLGALDEAKGLAAILKRA